ncbi:hypothetical protein GMORB2_1960 [Geosmithia morbida]|uniref:Oxidation resistance protein 1 n=1 Tax=Geosmithia morbida TaxID=1094350 RepID=A0A9P4YTK3_9HYPO|nr:uncharacterized protein GMORB2_1960 [Geosmithia morbida]KAF4121552.1 hypothetical protein GMORB2_1960 [Geosmithia morbida]
MWGLIRRFSSEDGQFGLQQQQQQRQQQQQEEEGQTKQQQTRQGKDGINDVFNPVKRTASPFRPPPLEPIVLYGYRDDTDDSARLLSHAVAEEIRSMIPERLRIVEDWHLIYSLEQDGASLATLYQKCKAYEGSRVGFVLVVRDQEGATFGAYLTEYPHPSPAFFGSGECFLWRASTLASLPPPPSADTDNLQRNTMLRPPTSSTNPPSSPTASGHQQQRHSPSPSETIRFKAFPYSGLNDFYINCETGFLSVGSGGGHYGLWLDDSLGLGHSSRCETFGNEPLSDEGEKFDIIGVELWVMGT